MLQSLLEVTYAVVVPAGGLFIGIAIALIITKKGSFVRDLGPIRTAAVFVICAVAVVGLVATGGAGLPQALFMCGLGFVLFLVFALRGDI